MCRNELCEIGKVYFFGYCYDCYNMFKTQSLVTKKCILCNKPLKKFTVSKDWYDRICHKSCYKDRRFFY